MDKILLKTNADTLLEESILNWKIIQKDFEKSFKKNFKNFKKNKSYQ